MTTMMMVMMMTMISLIQRKIDTRLNHIPEDRHQIKYFITFHESKRKRSLSSCVLYFLLHWFYYCQESLASRLGITSQLPFPSLLFQDWKTMFQAGMEGWGQKPKAISFSHSCTLPWGVTMFAVSVCMHMYALPKDKI